VKVVARFAGAIEIGNVKAMRSLVLGRHYLGASGEGREQRRKDCAN